MKMSNACTPPIQPEVTNDERQHPRYSEYLRYRAAISAQLVTCTTFSRWLEDTERDEKGFWTVFEVTSPKAQLAAGWYRNVFGPKRCLIKCLGPFDTQSEAEAAR
jgi:hypothetical protein